VLRFGWLVPSRCFDLLLSLMVVRAASQGAVQTEIWKLATQILRNPRIHAFESDIERNLRMDTLPQAPRPSLKPKVVVMYEQLFKVESPSLIAD
jgi:hypothetical protein